MPKSGEMALAELKILKFSGGEFLQTLGLLQSMFMYIRY